MVCPPPAEASIEEVWSIAIAISRPVPSRSASEVSSSGVVLREMMPNSVVGTVARAVTRMRVVPTGVISTVVFGVASMWLRAERPFIV